MFVLNDLISHTVGVDDLWLRVHNGNLNLARFVRAIPQGLSFCERNLLDDRRLVEARSSIGITSILNEKDLICRRVPGYLCKLNLTMDLMYPTNQTTASWKIGSLSDVDSNVREGSLPMMS